MATKILRARYGRPATATLAEVIRASKDGDPLAQMTVVVPNHTLGLAVRRQLAALDQQHTADRSPREIPGDRATEHPTTDDQKVGGSGHFSHRSSQ